MEIRLLGPVVGHHLDAEVSLGSPRQRAVAVILALASPEVVSVDRLVDGLWGEDPPAAPTPALQVFISGLRRALRPAGAEVERVGGGYRLTGATTDLAVVADLCRDADRAEDAGARADLLGRALGCWRGDPLGGVGDLPYADGEVVRLADLRLQITEQWLDARLRSGEYADLIAPLERLVVEHPMRERFWALLMTALYRADRQADALACYARARETLADELGIDPSAALQALELAILRQDPDLAAPAPIAASPTSSPTSAASTPTRPAARVPAVLTATFGRRELLADLVDLVADPEISAVTLVGPGGSGKSRLAILASHELGSRFARVAFLAATEATSAEQLLQEAALALTGADDLDSVPADSLVTLDNLEATPGAADVVAALVQAGVTVLATSRLPLRLRAERVVEVPALEVPDPDADDAAIAASPAAQMFADRARAVSSDFDAPWAQIADLVITVDGLPLAIELAAGQSRVRTPAQIAAAVRADLGVLTSDLGDIPVRQRSLADTIEWSLGQVPAPARDLLERLALFERSFAFQSLEVIGADLDDPVGALRALADARLVRGSTARAEIRFSVSGTVRAFARGRLNARADRDELASRLGRHLSDLALGWRARLDGPDSIVVLAQFDDAAADLNAVLATHIAAGRADEATALASTLTDLWISSGRLIEGRTALGDLLAAGITGPGIDLARAKLAHHLTDWATSAAAAHAVLDNDAATELERCWAMCLAGNAMLMTGESGPGTDLARQASAIAAAAGFYPLSVVAMSVLAIGAAMAGDFDTELDLHRRRLALASEHGDLTRVADTLNVLAEIALDTADHAAAASYASQGLAMAGHSLPIEARDARLTLARAAAVAADLDAAADHLEAAWALIDRTGQSLALGQGLRVGAALAAARGYDDLAVSCFARAQQVAPSPSGTDEPIEADLAAALSVARDRLGPGAAQVAWVMGQVGDLGALRAELDLRCGSSGQRPGD